jgi:hypothetical protein
MAANASNFSLVGGADKIFGTSFSNTLVGGLLGGNSITGLIYGSADDNAQTAINNTPEILTRSMGTMMTYGRRTSTIMSLNLAGKGGLLQALGTSGGAVRGAIGTAGKFLVSDSVSRKTRSRCGIYSCGSGILRGVTQ